MPSGKGIQPGSHEDTWERACRLREACACTHTECRDGWLDQEHTYTKHGQTYTQAMRCEACEASWEAHLRQVKARRS